MAKSKGNFYRLADVLAKGYDPGELRYLLLSTHYRKMLNFTYDALLQARAGRNRIRDLIFDLRKIDRSGQPNPEIARLIGTARAGFIAGLEDDLNVSEAMAALFEFVRAVNIVISRDELGHQDARRALDFIDEIDGNVLACLSGEVRVSGTAQAKAEARARARVQRDFKLADDLRKELLDEGYVIEDTKDGGYRLKRV